MEQIDRDSLSIVNCYLNDLEITDIFLDVMDELRFKFQFYDINDNNTSSAMIRFDNFFTYKTWDANNRTILVVESRNIETKKFKMTRILESMENVDIKSHF